MPYGQTLSITDASSYIPTEKQAEAAVAAVCERGPIGEARKVISWADYQRVFGGYLSGRPDQHCIKRALDNGTHVHVSRVVHCTDITDLTTKTSLPASVTVQDRASLATSGQATGTGTLPARFSPNDTLVVTIDAGAPATATFTATAAFQDGTGATYAAVVAGHILVVLIDGVRRVVTFAGTENTQALYHDAINAALIGGMAIDDGGGETRLRTDHRGNTATIAVHADTSADVLASLGLTAATGTAGTGNVADIESVSATEWETVVEAAVAGCSAGVDATLHPYVRSSTTGIASSVTIGLASTLDTVLGFDNDAHAGLASSRLDTLTFTGSSDGTWAHALRLVIDADPGDPTNRFRVRVTTSAGVVLETHDRLSMTSTDARYVVNVFRDESAYFTVTDLGSVTVAPDDQPYAGTYTPAAGADGTAGLLATDWEGSATSHTGLHAFDGSRGFRLVAAPGAADAIRHDVNVAGVAYAAARKDCRFICGVSSAITSYSNAIAFRRRTAPYATGSAIDSSYGAMYAGWHEIIDPVSKAAMWIPLDGEVLAALGRAGRAGGCWWSLWGSARGRLSTEVRRLRFTPTADEIKATLAAGVNTVLVDESGNRDIEGDRTLQKTASKLDRLNACLLIDFIGEQVSIAIYPLRAEPNDATLWTDLYNLADGFLSELAGKRGTFNRTTGAGYRVVCDLSNNPAAESTAKRTHLDMFVIPEDTSEEQAIGITVLPTGTVLE